LHTTLMIAQQSRRAKTRGTIPRYTGKPQSG
jgi:hypothetical protein